MKVSVIRLAIRPTTFAAAIGVNLLIATKVRAQAIAPAAVASPPPAQMTTGATAEMERVIVTGSNIPTAEETGPNPVDTYRPTDMQKLGIRNATDLLTNLPQEMGSPTKTLKVAAMAVSYRTCAGCCQKKPWFSSMGNALP